MRLRPCHIEGMPELVDEEEGGHGEEEYVSRHIMAFAQPWDARPITVGEDQGCREECGVGDGNCGFGVAVLGGHRDDGARGEMEDALASRRGGESVEGRWTKEPVGEGKPDGGCDAVLH